MISAISPPSAVTNEPTAPIADTTYKETLFEEKCEKVTAPPPLDDPDLFPDGGLRANLVIAGSFCGFIGLLAFVNAGGVLESYISKSILPDTKTSSIAWMFAINQFIGFGGTLVVGPMFDRIGARRPIAVGIVLLTLGIMCMLELTQLYQFVLSYGVVCGLGVALTFGPFLSVISHFFYRHRGRSLGIAYIGGAVGGLITPVIFLDLQPKIGFPWAIRVIGFICLMFLVLGWFCVRDRREVFATHVPDEKVWVTIVKSIDLKSFKDKIFTSLVLSLLGNGFAFLISLTYLPSYAVACGYPESKSYLLLTVFNSFSILGRVIPGILADYMGGFNTLCCIAVLSTISFFAVWLPSPVGHSIVGLYVFAGMYGFSSGLFLSLNPACIGAISKTKDFGKRSGTAFFVLSFADLTGIVIGGAIIHDGALKYYDHLVIFAAVSSLLGTLGALAARYLYVGLRPVKA